MRKPLIAGNWKMHGALRFAESLATEVVKGAKALDAIDIVLCPPFTYLSSVAVTIAPSNVKLGAQNLYLGEKGAFTGEISGAMLKDVGCQYVLVGHSERRTVFKETPEIIAQKFAAALTAHLTPILCIGETQKERETGKTEAILREQLETVIALNGITAFENTVIAYEPVWAIGTGLTATPEQAQEAHAFIRGLIAQNKVDLARTIRILYGGSMKAENAPELLAMPDIDGGLIGGASLEVEQFLTICRAAQALT